MKKVKKTTCAAAAFLALLLSAAFSACAAEVPENTADALASDLSDGEAASGGSTILVAYFSATNRTKGVAKQLALELGADIYEIVPEVPYTEEDLNYSDSSTRATSEQNDPDVRPAIQGSLENMDQYDTVLVGYPIWWGEAPRIMSTFIESYDFSGKTLAAFCTSGSSGFGSSDAALREAAPDASWKEGKRFSADASAQELLEWAEGQDIHPLQVKEEGSQMKMKIADTDVAVEWEDNESVEALRALCQDTPLVIQMSMYGGFEQVGPLGQSLPANDVQTTTSAGDIVLYSGDQIVVFYGSNSWAYTRLGKITSHSAEDLAALLGSGDVTITIG